MKSNDELDPVVEVALHLSKQDQKLEDINEPRYIWVTLGSIMLNNYIMFLGNLPI